MAAWLLNMLFDNQGGVIHYIYYRLVQFSYIAPIVDFAYTMNIHRAYVQSSSEETIDVGLEAANEHSVEYFYRLFTTDLRFGTGKGNQLESDQFTNKYILALASLLFMQVQRASYVHIAQVYEDAYNSKDQIDSEEPTMP